MDPEELEAELEEMNTGKVTPGTIQYLVDGENFFPRFIDAMKNADRSIDLRTYVFDNDDYALKIADVLKERSREVKVRVLLDGLPTINAVKTDPEYVPEGTEPPLSISQYLKKDSNVRVRLRPNILFSLDHTKTTIVDGRTAFIGGMNIGREYRYEWHDLMMEVKGPVVNHLQESFNQAWAYSGLGGDLGAFFTGLNEMPDEAKGDGYPIRVLVTRTGGSQIFKAQLAAIRRAKKYIYIENAYFADNHILYELVRARRRGVDVRVILPAKGNWGAMNVSNVLKANRMIENGIRVFLYPGMSHIKAAVYDGWACMGSANFDRASFRLNGEINIATSHPEAVQKLIDGVFIPDFERSQELTTPHPTKWNYRLIEVIANQM